MDLKSILLFFGSNPRGKLIISLNQFLLFFMMWYMLFSEYIRTGRRDLIFKVSAASLIEVKNLLTSFILLGLIMAGSEHPPTWFNLIVTDLFTVVLVSLSFAFVGSIKEVDFISWGKAPIVGAKISTFAVGAISLSLNLFYIYATQAGNAHLQTRTIVAINILNIYIICWVLFQTLLFRKKYKITVAIPFALLLHNHLVTALGIYGAPTPMVFQFLKTVFPTLIPLFFTSALFHELIDSINLLNQTLVTSLSRQRQLIRSLGKVTKELTNTSFRVRNTAFSTWENFSRINDAVLSTEDALNQMEEAANNVLENINSLLQNTQTLIEKFTEAREKISSIAEEALSAQNKTEETLTNINNLRQFAEEVTLSLSKLQEVADSVSKIAETITRLSEETNLISLNASVEAARSGVPGFAVVAQKVRNLAERSKERASTVQDTIEDIKRTTASTIELIKELIRRTEKSSSITREAGDAIFRFIDELIKALKKWDTLQDILDAEKTKLKTIERAIGELKFQVNLVKQRMKDVKVSVGEEARNVEILMDSIETLNDITQILNKDTEETEKQAQEIEKIIPSSRQTNSRIGKLENNQGTVFSGSSRKPTGK